MGGSVALAAASRGIAEKVRIWGRNEERVREVAGAGVDAFASTELGDVLSGAELIVMATPVGAMAGLARRIAAEEKVLAPGAVVTDVGSVKGVVDDEVRPILEAAGVDFIGSHPMAGSERTGWSNASAELFQDAVCVITPGPGADDAAVRRVEGFWEALGCRLFRTTPADHDRAVARISHYPHLVAAALVVSALEDDPAMARFSGNGFRDSTRVASGAPEMWTEILMENRAEVMKALQKLGGKVSELLELLGDMDHENLRRFLVEAKKLRDTSLHQR